MGVSCSISAGDGEKMFAHLKKEKVMSIAFLLALISALFVHPDKEYLEYVDVRVLALLFGLMLLVKGFQELGLFDLLIRRIFGKVTNSRLLCQLLVMLCFFSSMLITNDVALITFVPFAILALRMCHQEKRMITVVVLQTMAANLGSMFTPIGNPQNLYLFSVSGMTLEAFFGTMIFPTLLSFVLLLAVTFLIPRDEICLKVDGTGKKMNAKELVLYTTLFLANLFVVFRVLHYIPALLLTILGVLLLGNRKLFARVDYALLMTFIGFFIFVGNLGRIPTIRHFVEQLLTGRELVVAAIFSQFLSNVPAALMLSGFTTQYTKLLIGVNVGGLGTLIASMASLISYKVYAGQEDADIGKYMLQFTIYNVVGLIILLAASVCMMQ